MPLKLLLLKSSQGLTYEEASEIMSIGTRGVLVIDEKTGEKRKPTDQEALIILKRQADAFPETKEIYEKFKTAYDAKIELVAKYPELASTTIILEAENPEDKNDKKA